MNLVFLSFIDINECDSLPCFNGGYCQDKIGGFTCICGRGFIGNHCEGMEWKLIFTAFLVKAKQ